MTWWKKILSTIPLLIAGYEVGKNTEDSNNNKELVEMLQSNIQSKNRYSITEQGQVSYLEIFSILAVVTIVILYLLKLIYKAMRNNNNNNNNNNIQLQQI